MDKGPHVNFRSLTRGDGAVIGAAVLLLIASFLPYVSSTTTTNLQGTTYSSTISYSLWHGYTVTTLATVTLAGLIAGALLALDRLRPGDAAPLGIPLRHWGVALAVFTAWAAVWALFNDGPGTKGVGGWLSALFGLVLAAAAVLGDRHPALKAALVGAPKPAAPQGFAQPFGPGQPGGGYGYPAGQSGTFGGGPGQPGSPIGGVEPQAAAAPAGGPAVDAPEFAPFWFAVPVARPLYPEDGSQAPVADLTPGTWYLAVDQRGAELVAQTQDGRRGVLRDTTGIQRG
jgi:hypothetical protein